MKSKSVPVRPQPLSLEELGAIAAKHVKCANPENRKHAGRWQRWCHTCATTWPCEASRLVATIVVLRRGDRSEVA